VSFLRRTEYISSVQAKPKPADHVFLKSSGNALKRPEKRKASPEPDKGTPAWIKRRIEKSFEIAAANLADRSRVKHPSKRNLKVVDAFPVLPDLEAFPDSGAYVTVKFSTNPVNASDSYDTRLLSGIFKPIERTAAEEQLYETARAAWERDPSQPKPSQMMNYDFFLPADTLTGENFRAKFDVDNPDCDSRSLYTSSESGGSFRFPRVRAYETAQEKEMNHDNKYDEEVILAFRDDETASKGRDDDSAQKAVYYYPVMQRTTIRSQRTKNIARTIGIADEEETHLDELHVQIDDPSEELRMELARYKQQPVGDLPDEDEEEEYEEREGDRRREESDRGSASPAPNGGRSQNTRHSDEEQDAEGDEDE
jgi:RNA polymerase II-associated factor 1